MPSSGQPEHQCWHFDADHVDLFVSRTPSNRSVSGAAKLGMLFRGAFSLPKLEHLVTWRYGGLFRERNLLGGRITQIIPKQHHHTLLGGASWLFGNWKHAITSCLYIAMEGTHDSRRKFAFP